MLIRSNGLAIVSSSLSLPESSKLNYEIWPSTSEWVEKTLGIESRRQISGDKNSLIYVLRPRKIPSNLLIKNPRY
jgi:hypothetical protein